MKKPLEVNDHENSEVLRIEATDNDNGQANFEEIRRHADLERQQFFMPLPRIPEEPNDSESSED